jgi:hypothetical protein
MIFSPQRSAIAAPCLSISAGTVPESDSIKGEMIKMKHNSLTSITLQTIKNIIPFSRI